jgi:hypothetical protein
MMIENKVWIYLAVSIDSAGYTETYEHTAEKMGTYFMCRTKGTGSTVKNFED